MKPFRSAAVIGGGIAGIQASLDLAEAGFRVYLVDRSPTIGGHMAQLSETFPTLDCSQCILTPKMVEVKHHPNIELYTYTEVQGISGSPGNFKLKLLRKPRYVLEGDCTACDDCVEVCPVAQPDEFNRGLTSRKAIYIPFPQAVPSVYTLDKEACLGLDPLVCGKCQEACEPDAINFDMKEENIEVDVGAVILATGYELYQPVREYGYGKLPDVMDGLEFERLLSASGPTSGEIRRPSDGKPAENVVFIQCVGSRDPVNGLPYCSKICCMYTAKHAMLYKHKMHEGNATIFYMDIRAGGKNYQEFIDRAVDDGVDYVRGRVAQVFQRQDKLVVWGVDTINGEKKEVNADIVVLATAVIPNSGINELAEKLHLNLGDHWFLEEQHQNYRPFEEKNEGFYLAGCDQAPKDIPDSVCQGSAAASKVIAGYYKRQNGQKKKLANEHKQKA